MPHCRLAPLLLTPVLLALALSGCGADRSAASGPVRLSLWTHSGTPAERTALQANVAGFKKAHSGTSVDVKVIPEGDYYDALQKGLASGKLPDVLDVDGPLVASFAYQGALKPLDKLIGSDVRSRMLPSLVAQGTWRNHLWAVGTFDSGLSMFGDRRQLAAAGVRIPSGPADAWTAAEMARVLVALTAHDRDRKVLDLRLDYGSGEWLTYAFAPLVSSAGGALIDPASGKATLNTPAAVRALTVLRSWAAFTDQDKDGKAFIKRRVALSWVGHWNYKDYAAALGSDLVLIPLPDLGLGSKSGQGSWAWAVGAGTPHAKAAASLLSWLTNDASAATTANANGAVPGTRVSLAGSALMGAGKPLHLYADQLLHSCGSGPVTRDCFTVPRPVTPAYPAVRAAFSAAVASVLAGGDPKKALATATTTINTDLAANTGYTKAPAAP